MKTYIFADRKQNSLGPLDRKYCPALIPVAGRPVIVHTIEDLVNAGINHAYVVICSQAYEIEQTLGDGSRWGIQLEYILSQGEEKPSKVLSRLGSNDNESRLLVRGDIMRSGMLGEFVERIKNMDIDAAHACNGTNSIGVTYVSNNRNTSALDQIQWPLTDNLKYTDKRVDIGSIKWSPLSCIEDIYHTCIAIAADNFGNITYTGYRTESGYVHGRNHKVGKSTILNDKCFLGNNTFLGNDITVNGYVIIGDEVMVDDNANLVNCVIFPDTYIGNKTNIENSLIFENEIYRIDTGKSTHIKDDFLLSSLSNNSTVVSDRLSGVLLLILSLPLWPLAMLISAITSPANVLIARHITSNKKVYIDQKNTINLRVKTYEWNTSIPALRYLPWIFSVITGDLRLIGANPLFSTEDPILELMDDSLQPPQLGLISTASIELPEKTPEFEKRIHEIVYDKRRNFITDLMYTAASIKQLIPVSRSAFTSQHNA